MKYHIHFPSNMNVIFTITQAVKYHNRITLNKFSHARQKIELQRLMRVCPALSGTTQQMEIWASKMLRYLAA